MTKYSITQLNCYRECPYKYKLKYIDDIDDPFRSTDATFLGSRCHEALEALYKARMDGKTLSEEEFLDYYNANWKAKYAKEKVMHVDENYSEDYFRLQGEGMLSRYYRDIFLKDDMTVLGVETDDELLLPDGNSYYVRIDKLAYRDGIYYVCDYKTDKKAKSQSVADEDEQLAMYAVWVRQKFPNAKDVKLIWHMLRFDGDKATVESSRSPEQLNNLVEEIVALIKEIEAAEEFPVGKNPHCDYCTYKSICPKYVPPKVLTIEDGIKLVDDLVEKQNERNRLNRDIKGIQVELVKIAETEHCDVIAGSSVDAPIERNRTIDSDNSDWEHFRMKVSEMGEEDEYLMPNHSRIGALVKRGELDPELEKYLKIEDKISVGRLKARMNKEE